MRNQGVNRGNARFSLQDDKAEFRWKLRYYFYPFTSIRWYGSLFPELPGMVSGEIAPSYTSLSPAQVARAHRAAPDAKILFFMRNPVDRAWSHFMLSYIKSGRKVFDALSPQDMIRLLDRPASVRLSQYTKTLASWRLHYPPERMLVCFFDEIAQAPDALMQRVCEFLGIEVDDSLFQESSRRNIFKGVGKKMPDEVRQHLSKRHHGQLVELEAEFGGYASAWLQQAESTLRLA